jgi:predicted hotdog family 3-hydroxylacyl-ACP dehydratase
MRLDRRWIEAHIPHQGKMCLLDAVVECDADRIVCRASSHRAADNPLRAHGRLAPVCGVEYAAQAMAVHAAIQMSLPDEAEGPAPQAGYLASLRSVRWYCERLDDRPGDLLATATRIGGDPRCILYEFTLNDGPAALLEGRATVILNAAQWQADSTAGDAR